MTFQLAIVGHQKFYAKTVEGISDDDLKKYVRFVCVNEDLPKDIPAEYPKECVVNEWDIPDYESYYQKNNYYQNSVFFNLMNVIDTLNLDHIGFAQYDIPILSSLFSRSSSLACGSSSSRNTPISLTLPWTMLKSWIP